LHPPRFTRMHDLCSYESLRQGTLMPKGIAFLWYDTRAESHESLCLDLQKLQSRTHCPFSSRAAGLKRRDVGDVRAGRPTLHGAERRAHPFPPAFSLFVDCESQEEVDELWRKLGEGGKPGRCGWLTDKFGLSWQIIPKGLGQMLSDPDPSRSGRLLKAMLQMDKIDLGGLERAYAAE